MKLDLRKLYAFKKLEIDSDLQQLKDDLSVISKITNLNGQITEAEEQINQKPEIYGHESIIICNTKADTNALKEKYKNYLKSISKNEAQQKSLKNMFF